MKNRYLFPILFLLIAAAQVYASMHPYTMTELNYATKPLIMISLLVWFIRNSKNLAPSLKNLSITAIAFSWLGDVLLMFQEDREQYFLMGIGAFLIAQLSYAFAFTKISPGQEVQLIRKYPLLMGIYMAYGAYVFMTLKPKLGDLELPVLIYTVAILIMGITALNRYNRVSRTSYFMVLFGSMSFILSDSILAFARFGENFELSGVWVMATYMLAQYLIVRGIARQ